MKHHPSIPTLASVLFLFGCGPSDSSPSSNPATHSPKVPEEIVLLEKAPADTTPLRELLASAPADTLVAASGQIGGTVQPFGEGYAVFVLADESLMFCNEMGVDHCPTPWDACCEDPTKIESNRVLVQFSNEAGTVLPIEMRGLSGLQELDHVVVVGSLSDPDAQGNRILEAQALYRSSPREKAAHQADADSNLQL